MVSIIGALALTASGFVECRNVESDEFLDMALACQYPILPVFAPHLNTHPCILHSLKTLCFGRINLLTAILRC